MLKALLALIRDDAYRTPQELAEALDVPVPLVEQMLAQLVDGGYLAVPEACAEGCSGCSLAQACGARPGIGLRFWTLTAKGVSACS
ncbi:MAG: winged helix-turn-helix transcriptional regulator [Anaerolineae bacterium]